MISRVSETPYFNVLDHADRVVKACAWSDGGAEFFYGDGSVLSFCDHMNTFVALSPKYPARASSTDRAKALLASSDNRRDVGKEEDEEMMSRDMLFTAWTLSKYTKKVTEALHVYNYYSTSPRLIAGLTKGPCWPWPRQHPIDALILRKSKRFLERRRVFAKIQASGRKGGGPLSALYANDDNIVNNNNMISSSNGGACDVYGPDILCVPIGVQVTLWCALRRVSLTIHANRTTFSVRWPAPVTQPNGLKTTFVTNDDLMQCGGELNGVRGDPLFNDTARAGRLPSCRACQHTWVEQVFPMAQPPSEWREMLAMALELDRGTPPEEAFVDEGKDNAHTHTPDCDAVDDDAEEGADEDDDESVRNIYLTLPVTATSITAPGNIRTTAATPTVAAQLCRFSAIKPEHVHSLAAASTHVQWASSNRAIHGPRARVLWRYEADCTGREPHAVYWCLDPRGIEDGGRDAEIPDVLSLVREDESAVFIYRQSQGFVVQHARCDSTMKVYHLSSDGAIALPPVVGPLLFPDTQGGESLSRGGGALPLTVRCEQLISTFIEAVCENAAAGSSHSTTGVGSYSYSSAAQRRTSPAAAFCTAETGELTDIPFYRTTSRGRYLSRVADIAIQLSHWNLSVTRSLAMDNNNNNIKDAVTASHLVNPEKLQPCRQGFISDANNTLQRRLHPLVTDDEAIMSDVLDASAFRAHHGSPAAMSRAAADGRIVYLTTRIDGIGTFTALTNGVMRCHFDDRTILLLIPGVHDLDEECLVASCLFRNATRCVIRASQCLPSHPVYRYLAYALPFRRFVLTDAITRSGGGASHDVEEDSVHARQTVFSAAEGPQMPSPSPHAPASQYEMDGGTAGDDDAPSAIARASTSPSCYSTRFSIPTDVLECAQQQQQQHGNGFSMHITTWEQTVQDRALAEETELRHEDQRVRALLAKNEEISSRNRSLLSDIDI